MNLATPPTMTNEPNKPSQAQRLAAVLVRCREGLAMSRKQAEEALHRVAEVEAALDKLAAMAAAGSKA